MIEAIKKDYIQKGSALLQSMIAIVISSSMALVISQMMEQNQKEFKRVEARNSINSIHNSILNTIADQASCSITLRENDMSFSNFNNGDTLDSIRRCNQTVISDLNGDGINEVDCDPNSIAKLYFAGSSYAKNSIKIDSITYKNDGPDGSRLEIKYNIKGSANDDSTSRTTVTGISSIVKKIPLLVEDNPSNILTCQANLTASLNIAVEQSCHGNNAYIDKSGENWKCYHELDLVECPPGSVIVAVRGGADHLETSSSFGSWILGASSSNPYSTKKTGTESASNTNNQSLTFECLDIKPIGSDCDDSDPTTLDLTIITDKGDDLLSEFYKYKCMNVPNCYDNDNSTLMYDASLGFKYLTYNSSDERFECLQKKCEAGEIAITTEFGEQCFSCPAGSVIVKTDSAPGVMCSTASCNDSSVAGTNASSTELVQQYSTGRWNSDGTPECRDLVTQDDYCQSGGSLSIGADGSIKWECCPVCDASFDAEKAQVCSGVNFTTSNGCTQCQGTKDLQSGCPDPTLFCPGNDLGTSDCGQTCLPATGAATNCCPPCDETFDAERAQVCLGETFTTSNGCTQCEGTKPLLTGCPDPANYCSNFSLGSSECGRSCGNGTQPVNQGSLGAWSDWTTCDPNNGHTTGSTRTRSCEGATCGGNCGNPPSWQTEEYQNCHIYNVNSGGGSFTFLACRNDGGLVHYVSRSTGESCNNDTQAKSDYLNTSNPDCVPLCFFPVINQGTFRVGGSSRAYQNNGCGYNEFQFYSDGTAFPDCPTGWSRYENFSSAIQMNCFCCNSKQGNCSTPNSCSDTSSPVGWSYKNKDYGNYAIEIIFTQGQDVHRSSSGGSCNNTTTNFACHNYIFQVGCGR